MSCTNKTNFCVIKNYGKPKIVKVSDSEGTPLDMTSRDVTGFYRDGAAKYPLSVDVSVVGEVKVQLPTEKTGVFFYRISENIPGGEDPIVEGSIEVRP